MLESFISSLLFMWVFVLRGWVGVGANAIHAIILYNRYHRRRARNKHFPFSSEFPLYFYFHFIFFYFSSIWYKVQKALIYWFHVCLFVCLLCRFCLMCCDAKSLTICIDMCYNPCLKFLTLVTFIPAVCLRVCRSVPLIHFRKVSYFCYGFFKIDLLKSFQWNEGKLRTRKIQISKAFASIRAQHKLLNQKFFCLFVFQLWKICV